MLTLRGGEAGGDPQGRGVAQGFVFAFAAPGPGAPQLDLVDVGPRDAGSASTSLTAGSNGVRPTAAQRPSGGTT
jgi:hypothetical protein